MRLLLVVLSVSFPLLLSSVSSVYAHEKAGNSYFSIKVPHSWKYTEHSNTEIASIFGVGPSNQIILVPSQFSKVLLDSNNDKIMTYNVYNSGAFSQFAQETDYYANNVPLTAYIEYFANKYLYLSIISEKDSIVGSENATKIEGIDNSGTVKLVIYLLLHDNEAYNYDYVANVNDFDKYLPEFEEMIKSFRFNHQ